MDDPNMTMEEYIKLEEEKARRHGRVFNWQTATYEKIKDALQCKSQVGTPVNDEIDFRISFDESDDEDYTICDKNSFSYKMISVNNLKTDSENDNEKAGVPSFSPPKPTTSYIDDLDFFNDFENEFPAIVYNDAQTSKSDLLTKPILSPQHIDEFNNETSVFEYDEDEQNILYFNDIFPFNRMLLCFIMNFFRKIGLQERIRRIRNKLTWIYLFNGMLLCFIMNLYVLFGIPFDPKRYYKDGDCAIMLRRPRVKPIRHMALPPCEQRHPFLRYEGWQYTEADIEDFETRLSRIYWREMGISSAGDFLGTVPSYTTIRDPILRLYHRLIACSIAGRSQAPEKVTVTDLYYLRGMDVDSVNVTYLLARYLRLFAAGRKSGAHIYGGQFVARLAEHFGLLTAEILSGLTVITPELLIIDMAELVRLQIFAEDALGADEGDQAIPAPVQPP
ncbi:hypothetical protein Tco_0958826, partial [Tanacetum coccineum]